MMTGVRVRRSGCWGMMGLDAAFPFFPVTFYAAGNPALGCGCSGAGWKGGPASHLRRETRDLFEPQPVPVLAVQVSTPARQETLFQAAARPSRT